jgi:hypothetical protein
MVSTPQQLRLGPIHGRRIAFFSKANTGGLVADDIQSIPTAGDRSRIHRDDTLAVDRGQSHGGETGYKTAKPGMAHIPGTGATLLCPQTGRNLDQRPVRDGQNPRNADTDQFPPTFSLQNPEIVRWITNAISWLSRR